MLCSVVSTGLTSRLTSVTDRHTDGQMIGVRNYYDDDVCLPLRMQRALCRKNCHRVLLISQMVRTIIEVVIKTVTYWAMSVEGADSNVSALGDRLRARRPPPPRCASSSDRPRYSGRTPTLYRHHRGRSAARGRPAHSHAVICNGRL